MEKRDLNDRLNAHRYSRGGGISVRNRIPPVNPVDLTSINDNDVDSTYDPMAEAYNDENFNSYNRGPGANLPLSDQVNSRRTPGETPKLYIKNIPMTMKDVGLKHVFSKFGKVVSAYVLPHKPGFATGTGLVELETLSQARAAIEGLNNRGPHNLEVKFAQPKKIPNRDPPAKDLDSYNFNDRSPADAESKFSDGNRNFPAPQDGRVSNGRNSFNQRSDRSEDRKRNPSFENRCDQNTSHRGNYRNGKFNSPDDLDEVDINNKVYESDAKVYQKNRQASMGRSVYIPRILPPKSEDRLPADCNDECVDASLVCPYKFGSCKKCRGSSTNVCKSCKEFYCSQSCFQTDVNLHKTCRKREITFGSDGEIIVTDAPQEKNGSGEPSGRSIQNGPKSNFNLPKASNRNESLTQNYHVPKERIPSPQPKKKELETVEEKMPFPLLQDTFNEVLIVHTDEAAYYVMDQSRKNEFDEMLKEISEACFEKRLTLKNAKLGDACAALYDEIWYRCRITELIGSEATVLYIDFGNEETVKISSLKSLPDNLAKIRDFAIAVQRNKHSKIPLPDGLELKIKPIRMLKNHHLIAQIENDPAPLPELESKFNEARVSDVSPAVSRNEKAASPSVSKKQEAVSPANSVISEDSEYEKHTITYVQDTNVYWVTKYPQRLQDLTSTITSLEKIDVPVTSLKSKAMYGFDYDGTWCRALVDSLDPLTLFFLDYGNIETPDGPTNFIQLPLQLKQLDSLAFRVELEKSLPEEKKETDEIVFKTIRKIGDLTSLVRVIDTMETVEEPVKTQDSVENSFVEEKNPLPVKRKKNRSLYVARKCASVSVVVNHVFGDDCVSGTLISNTPDYVDNGEISRRLAKFDFAEEDVSLGTDVVARVGGSLHRGYIVKKDGNQQHVALVDYGQIVNTLEVSRLPRELEHVSENSVRVIFDQPMEKVNRASLIGKSIKLDEIKGGRDCLKAHSDQYGSVMIVPWEDMGEEMDPDAFELTSGSEVVISAAISPASVYIQALDPTRLLAFQTLSQDLAAYCLKEKSMTRRPLCNELVAARFDTDDQFYRARVLSRSQDKYRVIFVEYGNVADDVSLDDLKQLPRDFKCIPCFAVKVGLKNVQGPTFNANALKIINNYAIEESRFTANFKEKELACVELVNSTTRRSLNEELFEAMKPSWLKNPDPLLAVNPYMAFDIKYEAWPRNKSVSVVIVAVRSVNKVMGMLLDGSPAKELVMSSAFIESMSNYAQTADRYIPRNLEMCLAIYENEWYRSLCIGVESDEIVVLFIDYGNVSKVSPDEVRKMPPEFMEPPAYIKQCHLLNVVVDDKILDENKELLLKTLHDRKIDNCYVIDESHDEAVIWTDCLDGELKRLGFSLPTKPPI